MRVAWRIFSGVLALILCVVALFGLLLWGSASAVVRVVGEESLYRIMDAADSGSMLSSMLSGSGDNVLTQVAGSEAAEAFMADYVSGFAHYLLTGEGEFTVTEEQKKALVDAAVKATGGADSDASQKVLEMQLEVTVQGILSQYIPTYRELEADMGMGRSDVETLRSLFSGAVRGVMLGMVVTAILLIMLVRFSWYEWMAWGGFTGLVAGTGLVGVNLMLQMGMVKMHSGVPLVDGLLQAVIQGLGGCFSYYGLWILGVSAVLVVAFFAIRSARRRSVEQSGYIPA